ncbi:MAG: hypothetical protein ACP5KN_08135, partial [Armatimonadota bacterium]
MIRRATQLTMLTVVAVAVPLLLAGCGGGGPADNPAAPGADAGSVTLSVTWPAPAEGMQPQLIPQLSQRIDVTITDVAGEQVLVEDTIQRPETEPWTVQKTYEGVPTSDDALLSAVAYPAREPTVAQAGDEEVAQARGSMHIVIPCAGVAYPLEGEAGDPIELVLASTVVEVRVRPDPATVAVGMTQQMTATARNADGQVVLVPGFDWSVSNENATVD